MRKFIKPFAVTVAFTIPAMASADVEIKQVDEDKVQVTYSVDEASSSLGRAELERNIRRAAELVCGPQKMNLVGSIGQLMENRACYEKAVADALKSIEATG